MPRRKKRRKSACRSSERTSEEHETSSVTRWVLHPSTSSLMPSTSSMSDDKASVCTIRTQGKKPKEISITCVVEDDKALTEETTILRRPSHAPENATKKKNGSNVICHKCVSPKHVSVQHLPNENTNSESYLMRKLKRLRSFMTLRGTTWNNVMIILLPFALLSITMLIGTIFMEKSNLKQHCDIQCYHRYSRALYHLQKQFRCQNVWLWLTLRSVVWNRLFTPEDPIPAIILFVVPMKMTDTGYKIAVNLVEIFNSLHSFDMSLHIKFGSIGMAGLNVTDFKSRLYLELNSIQSKCQPAVLTDHLEMVSGVDTKFISHLLINKPLCNKLFVFTIYVPLNKANPLKIPEYLWELWSSQVTDVNDLIAKLTENMVFISTTD